MKHIDSAAHTRGRSRYVDDVPPPADLLHAAIFSSPVAHGKIRALNVDAAKQLDGVTAIFTVDDIPGENQIGPIIPDEVLLAEGVVSYIGQPIAVVVAKSPEIARKAAKRIAVEIDALPVITDPKEAFEKGEIIGTPRTFACGDVDGAWEKCDFVVEGTCDIGGQEHVYLETQRARATPLEGRCLRVHASTQSPYAAQKHIARVLGVPNNHIEIDVRRIGGGFGGKEDQATAWACMASLAAWHLQKPVELVLNRAEDMKMTGKRHPYKSEFKIGVRKDGKILAYEAKHFQNSGAAADLSTAILERTLFHSTNSYFIPNARIFAACCRTNLPPNTAFRGFGGPQGMFVIESAIASVAEKSGMPREEIQRKNLLQQNDSFPYGQPVQNDHARLAWEKAAEKYELHAARRRVDEYNKVHFDTKKGLAVMPVCFGISFTSTFMNQASALVHVYTDGSVSITTGGIEMGQGLITNIAAIAGRTFGIDPARIKIESTNTTRVANTSPSAASATTHLNGHATIVAINAILNRLKTFMAGELGASRSDKITIEKEKLFCAGRETDWSWEQMIQKAYLARIDLSAHGYYATPDIHFDRSTEKGQPFAYHVYGTAIVEVTLDCLRGRYTLDSVKIVHDLGRSLNKRVDLGQVEGGLAQGLGWMTIEDLRYDASGKLLSGALATYKLPDVYFMPDDIDVTFLEAAEPRGPLGNKAVGEPPFMYGIGVYFAIRHAMQAFRPDLNFAFTAPLTPERVLTQLHPEFLAEWAGLNAPPVNQARGGFSFVHSFHRIPRS